eukprot:TCONS_00019498-protein
MDGYFITDVTLRSIPVILHSIGLTLLLRVRYKQNFNKIQRLYLIVMSFNEMFTNLLRIVEKFLEKDTVSFHIRCFRQGFLVSQLYMVMTALTIDRLLFVRLNMRYDLYITIFRTKLLHLGIALISSSITVMLFITQTTLSQLNYNLTLYFWTISDAMFLMVSITCFISIKQSLKAIVKSLNQATASLYHRKINKALTIPTFIIVSFILTWIVGDMIYLYFSLTNTEQPSWQKVVLNL